MGGHKGRPPNHSQQTMARLSVVSSLLLAAYAVALSPAPAPMDCSYSNDTYGVSFNLHALAEQGKAYTVQDRIQTNELDYVYTFGICGSVAPPTNCLNQDGSSRVQYDYSPGWQTRASESASTSTNPSEMDCKYLGSPSHDAHEWSINEENPAAGVTLTYTNGQHCSNGERRKLSVNFKCVPKLPKKIDQTVIDESAHCAYELEVESEFACPVQCGLDASGAVCGGHGLCGFDTDTRRARCYCNRGRTGEHCTEDAESAEEQSSGPIVGLLIFIVVAMVIVIALLLYLVRWMQSRKTTIMGDVYTSLHSQTDNFDLERVESPRQGGGMVWNAPPVAPVVDSRFNDIASQL